MENKKKQGGGGGGASHGSLDHLFGPKDSGSASSSSLFGSIFPPVPSTGTGRERKQDFGSQVIGTSGHGKYGSPSFVDNKGTTQGYYSSKGESVNQNEGAEPCNFSSSIYYGGQENYSPRTGTTTDLSHQHHIFKKDGGDDDANGNNSNGASRGNWWQGSLYY